MQHLDKIVFQGCKFNFKDDWNFQTSLSKCASKEILLINWEEPEENNFLKIDYWIQSFTSEIKSWKGVVLQLQIFYVFGYDLAEFNCSGLRSVSPSTKISCTVNHMPNYNIENKIFFILKIATIGNYFKVKSYLNSFLLIKK